MKPPTSRACRLGANGHITLPGAIHEEIEALGIRCFAVAAAGPAGAALAAVSDEAVARAELAVMLRLLNDDIRANPAALTRLDLRIRHACYSAVVDAPIAGLGTL